MILIDVMNSLMPRNQLFYRKSEIVFVEYVNKKFLKFTKTKGDVDGFQDLFTFDYGDVEREFDSKENIFILYRNDDVECNIEDY
ncbi:hypothetical protein [Lysinibacillus fusiformis]|uniref:hypothetical protein n=1 Tax=Lysinibacillus fusiformis TaxID=28031 RepID=UPI00263A57F6|nr:hypothetical protein [Lysinibacillus fusiformis]MDC6267329.1 hypothetical protein [Lysinibacillus sphaericus]MDN4968237.1 hypothetical protein [Lysinibacillus fusiformis]MDN4968411.1 hypothetical protein [Lysinibacillus fusiformis]